MSAIKAGDLVMVVKPTLCCNTAGPAMGRVFVVEEMYPFPVRCAACKKLIETDHVIQPNGMGMQLGRLIKIDPPALPESVETEREVVA